jgi:hypothetical protein
MADWQCGKFIGMSGLELKFSKNAAGTYAALERSDPQRFKRLRKALGNLSNDPSHPGLRTHPYKGRKTSEGKTVSQSYVDQTGDAWRIWWHYGPEENMIFVLEIGPHPK